MGKELAALYPVAKETFDEADDALGYKLSQLCFDGPEDKLKLTEITQPAILTVSVAAWRVLQSKAIIPSYVAGHSLGEYSAHVAAGTLSFADAVRTVRNRGKYMQEAVPVGVGAMAAILALSCEEVQQVCEEAAQAEICQAANPVSYTHLYGPSLARRLLDSDGFVSGWQPGNGISQSAVVCSSLPSTTFGDAHHNGRDRKPVESGLSEAHSPHVVADQVRHAQSGIR